VQQSPRSWEEPPPPQERRCLSGQLLVQWSPPQVSKKPRNPRKEETVKNLQTAEEFQNIGERKETYFCNLPKVLVFSFMNREAVRIAQTLWMEGTREQNVKGRTKLPPSAPSQGDGWRAGRSGIPPIAMAGNLCSGPTIRGRGSDHQREGKETRAGGQD
jgi:hypothetical protein